MSYFTINNDQNSSVDNQTSSLNNSSGLSRSVAHDLDNDIIESDSCCSCFSNLGMFFSNLKSIITARESVNQFRIENGDDNDDQIYTIASNTTSDKARAVLNLVIPPLSRH